MRVYKHLVSETICVSYTWLSVWYKPLAVLLCLEAGHRLEGGNKQTVSTIFQQTSTQLLHNFISHSSRLTVRSERWSKRSDTTHDGVITTGDNDSTSSALNSVGREEGKVLGFNGVIISAFTSTGLGLRLSGQRGVINLVISMRLAGNWIIIINFKKDSLFPKCPV